MEQKITFIGLGRMGSAMAGNLLEAGYSLKVYNRTPEKAEPLVALGAEASSSLAEAVKDADIVFTSLTDDYALQGVTTYILPRLKKGAIHVSTSTILPKTANHLAQSHINADCYYIAAPVLGVPAAVKAKSAMTICSGDKKSIETVMPLLQTYSSSIKNLGEMASHANILKVSLNYCLIGALEVISELYAFAEKSGLDKEVIQESLKHIYGHPGVHLYIDKIYERNFDEVNFDMRSGNKDVKLFQQAFLDAGVSPDLANIVRAKFTDALANNLGDKDWSAISEVARQQAGLK